MNPLLEPLRRYKFARKALEPIFQLDEYDSFPISIADEFEGMSREELIGEAERACKELEYLTVANLFFIFEATLKNGFYTYLSNRLDIGKNVNSFDNNAFDYIRDAAGRKRFTDLLDLYKSKIDSNLVGEVKTIYKYKNWVAHGKSDSLPPEVTRLEPYLTFEILTEFLKEADFIQ